jgi:hypothetical protein
MDHDLSARSRLLIEVAMEKPVESRSPATHDAAVDPAKPRDSKWTQQVRAGRAGGAIPP